MKKKLLPLEQHNKSEVMLHHDVMRRRSNNTNDGRRRIIIWRNASILWLRMPFSLMDRSFASPKELLVRAYRSFGVLSATHYLSGASSRPLQRRLAGDSGVWSLSKVRSCASSKNVIKL